MKRIGLVALAACSSAALASLVVPLVARGRDGGRPSWDVETAAQAPAAEHEAHARALMKQVPLIDGHNDIPWAMRQNAGYDFDAIDLRKPQPKLHTDVPRLRQGLLGAQFWSVYVPSSLQGQKAVTATLEQVAAVHEMVRRYPDTFELARTADDVERIFKAGRIASLIGMEGGHSIDSSLPALRMFRQLGAGYMTLTHSGNVPWADAATDDARAGGLTRFGEAVVREMNWLGMLVDLSHVAPDTMEDALRVSEAPVIFSHSSARAICDVPRNVPDDVLRMLPKNGGVVMVTFVPSFVAPDAAEYSRRMREQLRKVRAEHPNLSPAETRKLVQEWSRDNPEPTATLSMVADHIDHVRKVAGIDHVGIGSDFDGIDKGPVGLEDVSKYPALVAELLRRGYSDEDVKKVLGLNVLRVMRAAEKVAARLQASRGPSVRTIEELDGKPATPSAR
jgi:membrane dipeptidase